MKILLVTEEAVLAELLAFRLELLGHIVEPRQSTSQLYAALDSGGYSLLIVDTNLPDANVRETITKIRGRWSKDLLPILVISMDQSLELVEQVYRCGADDYLLAPFDPQAMQNKIDRLLHRNESQPKAHPGKTKVASKGFWK
jgi:two-component system, OmpR family, response regulator